jgi:hypothetical protein
MSEQNLQAPINGTDRYRVEKMVDYGITGFADHFRMLSYWRRLLAGENDPEEIAQGLAMALRPGRYIPTPRPPRLPAITINVTGHLDPDALANAIKSAVGQALSGQR